MADIELFDELATLSFRLECGVSLLYAIYDDMDHDTCPAAMLAPAIHAAYEYLRHIMEEVQQLCNNYPPIK